MKTKFQSMLTACFALMSVCLASCSDDVIVQEEVVQNEFVGEPFKLTASQATPSRLALNEDGMTVEWEPGDQLVLVEKNRSIAPIYLNCDLEAKAVSATFTAEAGVPAGDYYVIYNYNENLVYGHKSLQSIESINSQDDLVLWGEISVKEGDTSANITLQHLYAKVRVVLENAPESGNFQIGMYASKTGFPHYKQFTSTGIENVEYAGYDGNANSYYSSNYKRHHIRFGEFNSIDNGSGAPLLKDIENYSALILPANVSDGTLYFFVLNENTCYEIPKNNVIFEAGKAYKVKLNLTGENVVTTTLTTTNVTIPGSYSSYAYQLSTPADCRHAAYRNSGSYQIVNDIDFQGETFLPINADALDGNDKVLKNISLDWNDDDNVGVLKGEFNRNDRMPINRICVNNLTLENIFIKGDDYVGAFGGFNIVAENCKVSGTSTILGTGNYVGGVVGSSLLDNLDYHEISNCSLEKDCKVEGNNYVGGILGGGKTLLNSCFSAATVTAKGDYVGGIFGNMDGSLGGYYSNGTFSLTKCVNTGNVSGNNYVGGIGGNFACISYSSSVQDPVVIKQSCSEGTVSGNNYVGGIVGRSSASINTCYSINSISATQTNVGGIAGYVYVEPMMPPRIANCYSLADLSVGQGGISGGICGTAGNHLSLGLTITNCYFAGKNNTTSCGIVGYSEGACTVSNCLTTLSSLGTNLGNHNDGDVDGNGIIDSYEMYNDVITNSLTGVTSILADKSVINGDNAYSDTYWPLETYPAYCVKFVEDFSGEVVAPGFGNENEI